MRRVSFAFAFAAIALLPSLARAQAQEEPPPPLTAPAPGERFAATPEDWKSDYETAREVLIAGDFGDAAAKFAALEKTATNRVDRALAQAQRSLAEAWASRKLAFVPRAQLGESNLTAKAVDKRTTDELAVLYTDSVFYGIGTGLWVAQLTQPKTAAGGILPMIAITGASVGTVVALDSGRGLRYGVAQSIASGLNVGFESGLVWAIFLENSDARNVTGKGAASLVWGLSTAGAITGGALGATLGTTPGRSSWVGSTALWTGTLAGLATGALAEKQNDPTTPLAAAGVGLAAGTALGLATASGVSPSISRVRFLDLGGIGGGLLGALLYWGAADEKVDGRALAGVTGLGAAVGLGAVWALTSSMQPDRPLGPDETPRKESWTARVRPSVLPADRGATFGVAGALD